MSRRLVAVLALATTALLPSLAVAGPAEAGTNRASCTTAAEYRRIAAGQTTSAVKRTVGNWGTVRLDHYDDVDVIFEGDGYGDHLYDAESDSYVYVGDLNGDWTYVEEDTDGDGVADVSYFDQVGADYETLTLREHVRRYKSCRGFNSGRATYVWFDNYTNGPLEGALTVYGKAKRDPLAGSGLRTAPKRPAQGTLAGRDFHVAG